MRLKRRVCVVVKVIPANPLFKMSDIICVPLTVSRTGVGAEGRREGADTTIQTESDHGRNKGGK